MRFVWALSLSLLINMALFWFIHSLLDFKSEPTAQKEQYAVVDITAPVEPSDSQPDKQPEAPQTTEANTASPALPTAPQIPMPALATPSLSQLSATEPNAIAAPTTDLSTLIGTVDGQGAGVLASGNKQLQKKLEDAKKQKRGFKQIIPVGTRQPDVPKAAWDKKIDGWVEVAFVVQPNGRVRNVQVIDASPKGVFEPNVVEAVSDWVYDADPDGKSHTLTQRIDLFWRDYPNNVKRAGQP